MLISSFSNFAAVAFGPLVLFYISRNCVFINLNTFLANANYMCANVPQSLKNFHIRYATVCYCCQSVDACRSFNIFHEI